jgi:hypothetical protein
MSEPSNLLIIWSSDDREVALSNTFMYARASARNAWWDTVRFIVWGPSAKLLANDEGLRAGIIEMMDSGVQVLACRACTDMYGVSASLEQLGVQVMYVGESVTEMLKTGWAVLTY